MPSGDRVVDPSHKSRNYSIDGLRGMAALLVVIFHASPILEIDNSSALGIRSLGLVISGFGGIAVAIFFLLSGFLLFGEFAGDLIEESGRRPLSSYFSRRILRIYPAYWVALIAAELLIGPLIGGRFGVFTLTERYFDQSHPFVGITIAWTLAIEVSFYLLLPIFAFVLRIFCHRLKTSKTRLGLVALGSASLIVFSCVYRLQIARNFPLDSRLQFLFPQFLGWFGLGMLLSVGVLAVRLGVRTESSSFGRMTRKRVCWPLAGLAYLGSIAIIGNDTLQIFNSASWWRQELSHLLLGFSACLVLVPVTIGESANSNRGLFSSPVMREVGLVSYGVYLWHDILLKYFSDVIAQYSGFLAFLALLCMIIPTSLAIGWLSYRLVERPAMRLSW